jgi:hypothetical protein
MLSVSSEEVSGTVILYIVVSGRVINVTGFMMLTGSYVTSSVIISVRETAADKLPLVTDGRRFSLFSVLPSMATP